MKRLLLVLPAFLVFVGCDKPSPEDVDVDADADADADADSDADTDADTDTDGPPPGASRVFVTSADYDGDLRTASGGLEFPASGDAICQLVADGAGLNGTFIAWLSAGILSSQQDPIDAIDRIADVGPWYTMRGEQAFLNTANFASTPAVDLGYDERGDTRFSFFWTGTEGGGRRSPFHCDRWTDGSSGEHGTTGSGEGSEWTEQGESNCNSSRPLLCIEQ